MPGTNLRDYQTYVQLDRQVQRLELEQTRRAGSVENAYRGRFTLSPTCPPSTSVRFQGGLLWWPMYALWSQGFYVPSYTVDLTDIYKMYGDFRFANAYWYIGATVLISQYNWPPPEPWPTTPPNNILRWYITSDEYETASEAEEAAWVLRAYVAGYYGHIAGTLVLKNNGNTEDYGQFEAVDPLNRGRSYIFDSRKRYGWELA